MTNGAASGNVAITVGGNNTNTNFGGILLNGSTATLGLTKSGTGTQTLSGANAYTGPTTVTGGTLEVTGSLSGTTSVSVTSGTLLLAGTAESINDAASLSLSLGTTLAFVNSLGSRTETFNSLILLGNAILDFGDGNTNRFAFTSGISGLSTRTLRIYNWSGPAGAGTQDILALSNTLTTPELNNISFYSGAVGSEATTFLGTGGQISFGGPAFELVPIPEPSSTALIGAAALLGLIGFRERRRLFRKACC